MKIPHFVVKEMSSGYEKKSSLVPTKIVCLASASRFLYKTCLDRIRADASVKRKSVTVIFLFIGFCIHVGMWEEVASLEIGFCIQRVSVYEL